MKNNLRTSVMMVGDLEELRPQMFTTAKLSQWAIMWRPAHRCPHAVAAMTIA